MTKILLVCLGNICRSPMAEGILKNKMEKEGLNFEIDSAGTGDYHVGERPDHRAIKCLQSFQIDISGLRARQITYKDILHYDYIFAMDSSNLKNVIALTKTDDERSKITLFLNEAWPEEDKSVPDPWFGDSEGFYPVHAMLDAAADAFIKRMKTT